MSLLEKKIKTAMETLKNNEEQLTEIGLDKLTVNGEQYFTDQEIQVIEDLGGINRTIYLSDIGELKEAIPKAIYDQKITDSNYLLK